MIHFIAVFFVCLILGLDSTFINSHRSTKTPPLFEMTHLFWYLALEHRKEKLKQTNKCITDRRKPFWWIAWWTEFYTASFEQCWSEIFSGAAQFCVTTKHLLRAKLWWATPLCFGRHFRFSWNWFCPLSICLLSKTVVRFESVLNIYF